MNYSHFEEWHDRWNDRWDGRMDRGGHRRRHGFNMVPVLMVLGGVFVLRHWFIAGIVMFTIGVAKTLRWMSWQAVSEPRRDAVTDERRPNGSEQRELDAIFAYADALDKVSSDNTLGKELRERAQKMVRTSTDATLALRALRSQLPPLKAAERDSFDARLQREVDLINAAEREINDTPPL